MSTLTASLQKQTKCKQQCRECASESKASLDAIRNRAYQLFLTRHTNGGSGDQWSDWVQAEREIKAISQGEVLMKGEAG